MSDSTDSEAVRERGYLPFGEYLPDLAALDNPGTARVRNVLPAMRSYLPFPGLSEYSDALAARCRGSISVNDKDGNVYVYAGTAAKLYSLTNAAWADVTRSSGGDYSMDERWEFVKWDQEVLATSFDDVIQTITLGGTNFAALSGTPPQARHIAAVRDFVVTGNTWDGVDGNVPNRVRWSGKGDNTAWTVSAVTQADYEDLKGSTGAVQRVVGGEYGVVFQEFAIWRLTYIGSPVIWQLDEVVPGRGTPAPGSVVQIGHLIFYLGQDGFEILIEGSTAEPIGADKIDRTFFDDFDQQHADRITAGVDPINRRVYWSYPGTGNVGGRPNRILTFDWVNKRWSLSDVEQECIGYAATSGYTLDTLDTPAASYGSEAVTNGGFGADSDWTKGTGWTIGSGVATHAAGAESDLEQTVTPTESAGYVLVFTVSNRTAGSVTPKLGGTAGTARSTNATFTEAIHAGSGTLIEFAATSDFDGDLDDVSLKPASLDALPESLDSRTWTGGTWQTSAFSADHKLGFFSGTPLNGELETVETQIYPGRRARLNAVRPLIDGGSPSVQVGTRARQQDAVTYGATTSVSATGLATTRHNSRYHRVRVLTTGDFEHALGVEVRATPEGRR